MEQNTRYTPPPSGCHRFPVYDPVPLAPLQTTNKGMRRNRKEGGMAPSNLRAKKVDVSYTCAIPCSYGNVLSAGEPVAPPAFEIVVDVDSSADIVGSLRCCVLVCLFASLCVYVCVCVCVNV